MTDFVYDTFTGSGLISGHTGETGGIWTDAEWGSVEGASQIELIGGLARIKQSGKGSITQDVLASGVPGGANYFVEATVNCAGLSNVSEVRLYARAVAGTKLYQLVFLPAVEPGYGYLYIHGHSGTGWYDVFTLSGSHTLRYEIEGSTHRGYLDGVLRVTESGASDTTPGKAGFALLQLDTAATYDITLADFRAGTLGAPPPSAAFWTSRVDTTEILT